MGARNFEEQFAAAVRDADSGCLIWQGSVDKGYARYSGQGAHRVSYRTFVGPIPERMTVDHICFNSLCVEPTHLRLLSNIANARNWRKSPRVVLDDNECVRGHQYTPENTYRMPNGRRDCRACIRGRARAYKLRRAAA